MSTERESVRVLLEAAELQRTKARDYQNPNSTVVQADYYPNGVKTIQDIIWAKCLRARSLLESGEAPKHESLEDTYKDMINYASFAIAYLRGKVPGQDPTRDAYNRPKVDAPKKAEEPLYAPHTWTIPRDMLFGMGCVTPLANSISVAYNSGDVPRYVGTEVKTAVDTAVDTAHTTPMYDSYGHNVNAKPSPWLLEQQRLDREEQQRRLDKEVNE